MMINIERLAIVYAAGKIIVSDAEDATESDLWCGALDLHSAEEIEQSRASGVRIVRVRITEIDEE